HAARRAAGMACTPAVDCNLTYHGGQVMLPYVAVYLIFWSPPTLQDGSATGFSANYGTPTILTGAWFPGHNPFIIGTQYFQTITATTTYISSGGGLGGFVVDNGAYPAADSNCAGHGINCVSDTQMRAKIQSVRAAQGWTGGMNNIFILLTSSGEVTCF